MDIPDYLTKTFSLNDAASLQYQNVSKEAYVIAIEDNKDELESLGMKFVSAKDFLMYFLKDFHKGATNRKESSVAEFEANKNKHAQVELTWTNDSTDFYMLITSVETPNHFYKILCWTIAENKEMLKNDFVRISKSLKD
ncbi:MAG TPA: hypothetical protein VHO72_04025 [Bacteroidales bacterium]|nr:hypothetical protein [Bacteroidales bacterium]